MDLPAIAGQLTDAGQTEITLAWEPSPSPAATGYRVETAPEPDGPWAAVGTVGAGEQLFTHALTDPAAWFRVVTESSLGDGGATAPRRAFTVQDELYDLRRDPHEATNLIDREPSAATRMAAVRQFFRVHALVRPGYTPPHLWP